MKINARKTSMQSFIDVHLSKVIFIYLDDWRRVRDTNQTKKSFEMWTYLEDNENVLGRKETNEEVLKKMAAEYHEIKTNDKKWKMTYFCRLIRHNNMHRPREISIYQRIMTAHLHEEDGTWCWMTDNSYLPTLTQSMLRQWMPTQ